MNGSRPLRDPGAQAERTALAWQRTAVAIVLLSSVLIWHAVSERQGPLVVLSVTCALGAGLAAVLVPRSVHGLPAQGVRPFGRLVLVVASTSVLALTGALTALVSASAHHP